VQPLALSLALTMVAKGPLLFWITADPRVTISILAASVISIGHKPASVKTSDNSQSVCTTFIYINVFYF